MDKRYFSKVKGAQFIQPDGIPMVFSHGFFDFKAADYPGKYIGASKEDPRNGRPKAEVYQEELDNVIHQKGGNPLFFIAEQVQSLSAMPAPIPTVDAEGRSLQNAKSEAEIAQQDGALAKTRHTVSGDLNTGAINADPNASTLDHALVGKVADFNKGASKAEELRAAAQARAAQSVSSK